MSHTDLIAYALRMGWAQLPAPPPAKKHRPIVIRPERLVGLPTIAECKARHICIQCRVQPAVSYGSSGYGVKCHACIEHRRAKNRGYTEKFLAGKVRGLVRLGESK